MNHWPFIIAAYVLTIIATVTVLVWSLTAMRRAEAAVNDLRSDR